MEKKEFIVEYISNEFSKIVNREFEQSTVDRINELNATPEYEGCCATQDLCDANMLMGEAFTTIMKREIDVQNQSDIKLWNSAWDLSKARGFKI